MSTIEFLVVLALVVVVGLGIIHSLTWTRDQLFGRTDIALASAVQAQHAMDLIREDLANASSQGLTCGQNTLRLTRIIGRRPDGELNTALVSYARDASGLRRQNVVVVGSIIALETNCNMPGMVTVGLSARVRRLGFSAEQTLTTKVVLQNS